MLRPISGLKVGRAVLVLGRVSCWAVIRAEFALRVESACIESEQIRPMSNQLVSCDYKIQKGG